jgi:hypothetical protein
MKSQIPRARKPGAYLRRLERAARFWGPKWLKRKLKIKRSITV